VSYIPQLNKIIIQSQREPNQQLSDASQCKNFEPFSVASQCKTFNQFQLQQMGIQISNFQLHHNVKELTVKKDLQKVY